MKHLLTATAALAALTAVNAQVSGPRTTAGDAGVRVNTPSTSVSTPDTLNINGAAPTVNPRTGPLPRTSVGSPDARGGALTDSLRDRTAFPSSRDWETSSGLPDERRRLTPIPGGTLSDVTPPLDTIDGAGSTIRGSSTAIPTSPSLNTQTTGVAPTSPTVNSTITGVAPTTPLPPMKSDLNTTGVNTPPRASEQPLDQALSAKIRAELSQTPAARGMRLPPETVRDLRITSQGGRVVLEGNVNSLPEKQLVEAQARRVPGVTAIDNRVNVTNRGLGAPATSQIGQSRQNISDLNEERSAASPDLK
jgi:hypothetical protein